MLPLKIILFAKEKIIFLGIFSHYYAGHSIFLSTFTTLVQTVKYTYILRHYLWEGLIQPITEV